MSLNSYVKNAIAALATAGALTLGSANPAYASQNHSDHKETTYSSQASSNYVSKLDGWIRDTVSDFGLPDGFPKDLLYSNDKEAKKAASWALFYAHKNKEEKKHDLVHLVPYRSGNGSFYFVDKFKGFAVASIDRLPHGMFEYFGSAEQIPRWGGRAEIRGIADAMANGEYFDNK